MAAEVPPPAAPLPALPAPRWARVCLAGVFLACLGAGFWLTFLGPGARRQVSHIEKRTLAPQPGWPGDLTALSTFPKRSETWVNDHLYERERLMGINSYLQVMFLHQSPVTDVIIGQRGWLYYNIGTNMDDYRGLERLPPENLAFMRRFLTVRRDWFRRHGVRYLFVVAPDKHTVYPDFLPEHYRRKVRAGTELDQFLAAVAQGEGNSPPVEVLDLRPALARARQAAKVYMQTDTHWNEAGARTGAQAIRDWMQAQFPDRHLPPATGGPPQITEGPGGDLAVELGLTRYLRETSPHWPTSPAVTSLPYSEPGMEPWQPLAASYERQDGAADLSAVFLHDSYTHLMKPSLAEACRRSLFLGRPNDMHFASHDLMSRLVETYRPDVVVEEVVERNLGFFFSGDPAMATEIPRFAGDLRTVNGSTPTAD